VISNRVSGVRQKFNDEIVNHQTFLMRSVGLNR